ncbi:MAG: bifunctional metallophosphatase/5'-nucleotidase [Cyclobacteriaceae bacterium]
MPKFSNINQRIILLSFLILSVSCRQNTKPDKLNLVIVATTDIHGAIFPVNYATGSPRNYSQANVATYLDSLRQLEQAEIIVLDNGDILQGDPAVYYYNFEDTASEHIVSRVMNYLQYDAMTIGNHDIEAGHNVYDKLPQQMNFPMLAANAINTSTNEPYFQPYTIIERQGVRIAVLGLITPGIPKWLPEKIWEGIFFEDMLVSAQYWVPKIMEDEKPDLMVGLFHAGKDYTYSGQTAQTPFNENASLLVAEQVPGFDVVFIGHDHKNWNESVINAEGKEVLLIGANAGAKYVSQANIEFQRQDNGKYEIIKSIALIEMEPLIPSASYLSTFAADMDKIEDFVNDTIGYLQTRLDAKNALFGDNEFVELIHQLQMELTGADLSFTAPLAFNTVLDNGFLKVSDMFLLYRYENLLYNMKLTGTEIRNFLEFSYGIWFNTVSSPNDHLLNFKRNKQGKPHMSNNGGRYELASPYFNFDSAEGIVYLVDVSKPVGERIEIKSFTNGRQFHMDSTYDVAINSYRGNGGGGHLTQGAGISKDELPLRITQSTDKDLRYYLMHWIRAKNEINISKNGNWKLIPEDLVKKVVEKDQALLFSNYSTNN